MPTIVNHAPAPGIVARDRSIYSMNHQMMNTMKKLMMIVVATALVGTAHAQDSKAHEGRANRAEVRTEQMVKVLGLTPEQATKVRELNERLDKDLAKLREEHATARKTGERPTPSGQGREMKAKFEADLKAVLTPEQWTKWEEHQQVTKAKRMEMREHHKTKLEAAPNE